MLRSISVPSSPVSSSPSTTTTELMSFSSLPILFSPSDGRYEDPLSSPTTPTGKQKPKKSKWPFFPRAREVPIPNEIKSRIAELKARINEQRPSPSESSPDEDETSNPKKKSPKKTPKKRE